MAGRKNEKPAKNRWAKAENQRVDSRHDHLTGLGRCAGQISGRRSKAGQGYPGKPWAASTISLRRRVALNATTRRAVIGTTSPVFGLRPGRSRLSRNSKLPNPDSFTPLPPTNALRITSKMASTISLDSCRLSPTRSFIRTARSALVTVATINSLVVRASQVFCTTPFKRHTNKVTKQTQNPAPSFSRTTTVASARTPGH